MGPWMFRLLLMSMFAVLFVNERDRVLGANKWFQLCRRCEFHNGYSCNHVIGSCWKFKIANLKRACVTDNFYYYDRVADRYNYRYSVLSCRTCEEGSFMLFHDLYRETFCCTEDNCNDPEKNMDISKIAMSYP
ncbi:prostate and testis expressed protein 13-like [Bos indicus]|uniref:Prostate and testis expressed protein 13-like n=1 Tax=Bos indicus TaxID=9915 RepID=A0ABM4RUE0_BOSIN